MLLIASPVVAQEVPDSISTTSLKIAPALLHEIVANYEAFPIEEAYCLYGGIYNTTEVVVNGIVAAEIKPRTERVHKFGTDASDIELTEPCGAFPIGAEELRYLGILHTHHIEADSVQPLIGPSVIMTQGSRLGISCSHFYVLPSGDVSFIPTNDLGEFQKDTTGTIAAIFCGDRVVWIDKYNLRKYINEPHGSDNKFEHTVYLKKN